MGGAVKGSNPFSDGVVALSNYIGKCAEHILSTQRFLNSFGQLQMANDDGFRRFEGRDITSYDGRVVKAGA